MHLLQILVRSVVHLGVWPALAGFGRVLDPSQHAPAKYRVRLHFAEPENLGEGERVFDVSLQGQTVLPAFDIVASSGSPRKAHIEEFHGIEVKDSLRISLNKIRGDRPPVLNGLEVRRE